MKQPNLKTKISYYVKRSPDERLSVSKLFEKLISHDLEVDQDGIKSIINEMMNEDEGLKLQGKSQKHFLKWLQGGEGVRYTGGGGSVKRGTGVYKDITKVINNNSDKICKIFGSSHLESFDVHPGRSRRGKWGRPDILVKAYLSEEKSRSYVLHSIEFEKDGEFTPENVAQAYYSGIGADYCWLLFDGRDWPKDLTEKKEKPNAERIRKFAQKLGVGLIHYTYRAEGHSWTLLQDAERKPKKGEEKEQRGEIRSFLPPKEESVPRRDEK